MAIHLIRHGETAFNAGSVVQHPDTPLSENGLEQAARLAARLAEAGITRILASDYTRAAMTAAALEKATGIVVESEPLLRERNLGDLRGRPYSEFDFDPFAADYEPPNGESWEVFHARVDDAWKRVAATALASSGHLAVVTHGLVCASVVQRLVAVPDEQTTRLGGWLNTSVTILDDQPPWTVRLLNCASHLDEARARGPA